MSNAKKLFSGRVMSVREWNNNVTLLVNVVAATIISGDGKPETKVIEAKAVDVRLPLALGQSYLKQGLASSAHVTFSATDIAEHVEGDRVLPAQTKDGIQVRPELKVHRLIGLTPESLVITRAAKAMELKAETNEDALKASKSLLDTASDFIGKLFTKKDEAKAPAPAGK